MGDAVGGAPRGFWAAAHDDPSRTAVIDSEGNSWTAGELLAGANQLVHGLPFHFECDQEGRNLRMARLAAQDDLHGGLRIRGRQVLFGNHAKQVRKKRHDIIDFL